MSRPKLEVFDGALGGPMIVHARNKSCRKGCPIHNPTDPHKDWPLLWRGDRYLFERVCKHGIGHPDKDSLDYLKKLGRDREAESVHGCDGCCHVAVTP